MNSSKNMQFWQIAQPLIIRVSANFVSHNTETVWGGLRAGGEEGRINATTETHMNEHKTSARSIFQGKVCRVIHVYDQKVCNTI